MSITERTDAITGMQDVHPVPTPPCPRSVTIELTARRNFRCAFRATASRLRQPGDMDWEPDSKRLPPMPRAIGVAEVGGYSCGLYAGDIDYDREQGMRVTQTAS